MKVKIEVTAEDILRGRKKSCNFCPIALAVMRRFPECFTVTVTEGTIKIVHPYGILNCRLKFITPSEAVGFIWRFDDGGVGKPFAFEMEEAK